MFLSDHAVCLPGWAKSALPACSHFLRILPQSCLTPFLPSPATLPCFHSLPALGRAHWGVWQSPVSGDRRTLSLWREAGCAVSSVWHLGTAGSDVSFPIFHPLQPRSAPALCPNPKRRSSPGSAPPALQSSHRAHSLPQDVLYLILAGLSRGSQLVQRCIPLPSSLQHLWILP